MVQRTLRVTFPSNLPMDDDDETRADRERPPRMISRRTLRAEEGGEADAPDEASQPIDLVDVVRRGGPGHARYRVRSRLGGGGMGEVHLGEDDRLGRIVAIKAVHGADADHPELTARFLREARVQGQLEHPAIAPVYDLDWDEQGHAFFTMRRIAGDTLAHVLRELRRGNAHYVRAYSQRRLLAIFQQVCLAIDFAHERGVIHRDLKPQNLMLGDFGEVYVMDWGIAKIVEDEADTDKARDTFRGIAPDDTAEDQVFGTAGYMAPEQIESSASADARSDVYSLGAVLFQILSLEPLHGGGGREERLRSTRKGGAARPSARAPSRKIAPELDAICVKATALDPADRFPSARALHDAVERFLEGERDLELRAKLQEEDFADARRSAQRALGPLGGYSLLGFALLSMQLLWLGVRSWFDVALIIVPILLAAAHAFYIGMAQPARFELHAVLLAVPLCVAIGAATTIVGPVLLTPMLALAIGVVACTLRGLGRYRLLIIGMAFLVVLIPFVLERSGLAPQAYAFHDGAMTILPNAVALPEDRLPWFLLYNDVATLGVVCLFVWRAIDQRVAEARSDGSGA